MKPNIKKNSLIKKADKFKKGSKEILTLAKNKKLKIKNKSQFCACS